MENIFWRSDDLVKMVHINYIEYDVIVTVADDNDDVIAITMTVTRTAISITLQTMISMMIQIS